VTGMLIPISMSRKGPSRVRRSTGSQPTTLLNWDNPAYTPDSFHYVRIAPTGRILEDAITYTYADPVRLTPNAQRFPIRAEAPLWFVGRRTAIGGKRIELLADLVTASPGSGLSVPGQTGWRVTSAAPWCPLVVNPGPPGRQGRKHPALSKITPTWVKQSACVQATPDTGREVRLNCHVLSISPRAVCGVAARGQASPPLRSRCSIITSLCGLRCPTNSSSLWSQLAIEEFSSPDRAAK
jgi:hypothetical protein